MAITVKHKFVSAIPDGDDASVVRPSNWNDTHELTGLGTMAEQNANAVAITGGTMSGVAVSGYVPTTETISAGTGLTGGGDLSAPRTIALANTAVTPGTYGSDSRSITQVVDQQGRLTNIYDQPIAIANTQVSGLGTASTKDAGVANGVATLDGSGTVPISQLPAAVLGALSYQGTWDASTNTPTLTSSVGTKGYYYVVNVAGSTNLNGITDWKVGDWAVYNGTAWQKIDNTDAVTSVNGYTGTVVLNYADVGAFPATTTTGTGSVVLQTSPTINTPTLSGATVDGTAPYMNYTPTTAPTYLEGRVFYDSTAHTLNYYNDNSQMSLNIGQEQVIRVRNQTGTQINNGSVVYVNGATGNTPTINLALATTFSTSDIIGVATTDVANNGFGYVTVNGLVNGLDTSAFADGNPVFLSATTPGAITATEPVAPNYSVQVGVIIRANPSVGTLLVATQQISTEVSHIIGTLAVNQGGTGQTSYTNGQLLIGNTTGNTLTKATLTAGTGVSVTNGAGSISIANTGVTSAVAGTGISVSGSTGAVTVTNTAPDQTVALSNGTGISVTGTYPNFTITNTAPSSGGTVTSVTGTAPVVSSGGNTPAISMAKATGSVDGYLSSTDWTTFNNKQPAGSYLTAVTADAPLSGSGTSGSHLVISQANTSTNGYLSSTDWNTFNGKAPAVTYTTNYVPYGQGTTTPALSANLQFNGTNLAIGGTLSAWSGVGNVLQITGGAFWGGTVVSHHSLNTYYDGSNYKYLNTDYATDYYQYQGTHVWRAAASGTAGSTAAFLNTMTLDAVGNLALPIANSGITFNKTGALVNSKLNDYEEGTFTPSVTSTSGTITTVGATTGQYTKIGDLVTVIVYLPITTNGTGAGLIKVSNMPFTCKTGFPSFGSGREQQATGWGLFGYIDAATTNLYIQKYDGAYPGGSGYGIGFTITYKV
jgi:hypothetical protein